MIYILFNLVWIIYSFKEISAQRCAAWKYLNPHPEETIEINSKTSYEVIKQLDLGIFSVAA